MCLCSNGSLFCIPLVLRPLNHCLGFLGEEVILARYERATEMVSVAGRAKGQEW